MCVSDNGAHRCVIVLNTMVYVEKTVVQHPEPTTFSIKRGVVNNPS